MYKDLSNVFLHKVRFFSVCRKLSNYQNKEQMFDEQNVCLVVVRMRKKTPKVVEFMLAI